MMRFPYGIDLEYAKHESEERMRRVIAMGPIRYGQCAAPARPVDQTMYADAGSRQWTPYP